MSTTQISVRLPEELVAFVDEQVRRGAMTSRAAVLAHAIEREQRRVLAERDIAILKAGRPEDDDLSGIGEYAASVKLDDLD
jgi:Arc/MetJ-type ribon-helix-helix transcriptional regulator